MNKKDMLLEATINSLSNKIQESDNKEELEKTKSDIENLLYNELDNTIEDFPIKVTRSTLDVLIADEESAIDGYKEFLKQAKETIDKRVYDLLEKEIQEIITDEEEHIDKLNVLKDSLDVE